MIIDRKEVREINAYTKPDPDDPWLVERLAAEPDATEAYEAVCAVLVRVFEDLRRIFKHYSAGDAGGSAGTMALDEFYMLVKDCKISCKNLTMKEIRMIFAEANDDGAAGGLGDWELMANEFVEALIRIADEKFCEVRHGLRFFFFSFWSALCSVLTIYFYTCVCSPRHWPTATARGKAVMMKKRKKHICSRLQNG